MGLRTEIKNILSKALDTGPANNIIEGVADLFAPVTKELRTLEEVNHHRLPDSIGMQEAPTTSVLSMFVQTCGKLAMYPLPFAARKKFRDVYGRGYDDLLSDSDGKTFPDIGEVVPWDSEVGCFLRFSMWNAQAIAASALTIDERRIELLEKELEWSREDLKKSEDKLNEFLARPHAPDREPPEQEASDHTSQRLTATEYTVKNLLAGFEEQAQELVLDSPAARRGAYFCIARGPVAGAT